MQLGALPNKRGIISEVPVNLAPRCVEPPLKYRNQTESSFFTPLVRAKHIRRHQHHANAMSRHARPDNVKQKTDALDAQGTGEWESTFYVTLSPSLSQ